MDPDALIIFPKYADLPYEPYEEECPVCGAASGQMCTRSKDDGRGLFGMIHAARRPRTRSRRRTS